MLKVIEKEQWGVEDDVWDHETGMPGISLFATALQVWSFRQDEATVAEAAAAFKIHPENIVEAVEWHPFMILTGPSDDFSKLRIEHDGE